MKKHPKERLSKPSKIAENDAYLTFKSISDFILQRIQYYLKKTESKK